MTSPLTRDFYIGNNRLVRVTITEAYLNRSDDLGEFIDYDCIYKEKLSEYERYKLNNAILRYLNSLYTQGESRGDDIC
jgi:hypothetical protein